MSSPALRVGAPRPPTPQAGHLNVARRAALEALAPSVSCVPQDAGKQGAPRLRISGNSSGLISSNLQSENAQLRSVALCFLLLCPAVEVVRL